MLPTILRCSFGGYPPACTKNTKIMIFGIPRYLSVVGVKPSINPTCLLRLYSYEIEDYSGVFGIYYSDIPACDIGDIHSISFSAIDTDITTVIHHCIRREMRPLIMGGEHTFTYFIVREIKPKTLIVFDAHLDLRDTYYGDSFNHATFMRRAVEHGYAREIYFVGARAFSKEEREYVDENKHLRIIDDVRNFVEYEFQEPIYVSIDLDVLDPCYMTLVSSPEPLGLSPQDILAAMKHLSKYDILGLDIMEFTPYTLDMSSISLATKIVFEGAATLWQSIKARLSEH